MGDANESSVVFVAGVTSAIGRCIAEQYGQRGHALIVTARDTREAEPIAADLRVRFGVNVATVAFDAESRGNAGESAWLALLDAALSGRPISTLAVAFGAFAQEPDAREQPTLAERMMRVNADAVDELVAALEPRLSPNASVAVVSSVAGDRPRPSLMSYALSKQAVNRKLRLREASASGAWRLTLIKPGPVATPMTWGVLPPGKGADPHAVAARAVRAIERGRPQVYCPGVWKWVMLGLRCVPGPIFRRLPI